MKRRWAIGCALLLCSFSACVWNVAGEEVNEEIVPGHFYEESEETESKVSYRELEKMEELTVEGDTVTIVLYENQALPYRWKAQMQGEALETVSEETVAGKGALLREGASPAYHVFTFDWVSDGEVQLEVINARISSPDDTEFNGKRLWLLNRQDGKVTWELLEETE